jgi:hypothetical protein
MVQFGNSSVSVTEATESSLARDEAGVPLFMSLKGTGHFLPVMSGTRARRVNLSSSTIGHNLLKGFIHITKD